MRILYLVYTQKISPKALCKSYMTGCSWVDAFLSEIKKLENIKIAIGVPTEMNDLIKLNNSKITFFGIPVPSDANKFTMTFKGLNNSIDITQIINNLSKVIKEFNPDIIQIFGTENPFGLVATYQTKPVVLHLQGNLSVVLRKWFLGITRMQQFRSLGLKNLFLKRGTYYAYFDFIKRAQRETTIIKNCKYFIGRTNFDKRIVSLFSPNSTYFHCDEFIRREFFKNRWNFPLNKEIKCVSILKGTSYKGIDVLVETLIILKKFSDFSFEFKVCGVSDNEEIIRIIKKKYKRDIDSINIKFLGKLNADELIKQLCSSNFYLHPSYIENSPNSVCEAMLLGMPIISTNVGGISSLIDDTIEGLLIQEGEPYSMAAALLELIKDYNFAITLGQNARRRALIRHNSDKLVNSMLEIYHKIMHENDGK